MDSVDINKRDLNNAVNDLDNIDTGILADEVKKTISDVIDEWGRVSSDIDDLKKQIEDRDLTIEGLQMEIDDLKAEL